MPLILSPVFFVKKAPYLGDYMKSTRITRECLLNIFKSLKEGKAGS